MTFRAKPGRLMEMIELLKAERERIGGTSRIYSYLYGPRDVMVNELTFETEQERQKFWDEWRVQPEAAEFLERFDRLRESGGTSELLRLY
jgi:hypothetical protein